MRNYLYGLLASALIMVALVLVSHYMLIHELPDFLIGFVSGSVFGSIYFKDKIT